MEETGRKVGFSAAITKSTQESAEVLGNFRERRPARELQPLPEGVFEKPDIHCLLWDTERIVEYADVKPAEMLFLGPFQYSYHVDRVAEVHRQQLEMLLD